MDRNLVEELFPTASPYHRFSREQWASLRADTALTMTSADLRRLQSINEPITMQEVIAIYLPLSRLLALHVAAAQGLFKATQRFLGANQRKVPFIIGVAGSVAVGKSTFTRVMQALLSRWPNTPRVDLVTTDGFLLSNAALEREGLMKKKGHPETYKGTALLSFVREVKAGRKGVEAPTYSYITYDLVEGRAIVVDQPDILILEGLNVLTPGVHTKDGRPSAFVSDFLDFSIYLDAREKDLERWFVERFMRLRKTSFRDPHSYFGGFAYGTERRARAKAHEIWQETNRTNLHEHILPTRSRASLILLKDPNHLVERIELRKL